VFGLSETLDDSAFLKGIREEAKSSNIWISVGLHEVPSDYQGQQGQKQCYNSQCLVSPDGELASIYRKLHLFDVDFKGSMSISESNTTLKGNKLPDVVETSVGKGASQPAAPRF
jgi:predicted amidohydrolase